MAYDTLDVLRKKAKESLARGDYHDALKIYQKVLLFRGDSLEIHYGIASIYYVLGKLENAVEHFKMAIQLDPLHAKAYINLGAIYHRLGLHEDSLNTLQRGLQLDSRRAEGYYNFALVHKHLGNFSLAIENYHQAIQLNPRMYEAHYNLANLYRDQKDHAHAVTFYKLALELRPNCHKALAALEDIQKSAATTRLSTVLPPQPTLLIAPAKPSLDPFRQIDPILHGGMLRDLHHLVIEVDTNASALLTYLQEKVEERIRELSICILTPNDPTHNLEDETKKFENMLLQLQQHHENLQSKTTQVVSASERMSQT